MVKPNQNARWGTNPTGLTIPFMNIVAFYLEPHGSGFVFKEHVACANHWSEQLKTERTMTPVGRTNEFCHWCATEEASLMLQVRQEDWVARVKMESTVYISGPMSGLPEFNRPNFWKMEHALKPLGCRILSPAHHDKEKTYQEYMKASTDMVFECDCVVMLRGYQQSKGAMAELTLATALEKPIYYSEVL